MGEKLLNEEQVNVVLEFSDALRNYGYAEGFWSPWQSNQNLRDLTGQEITSTDNSFTPVIMHIFFAESYTSSA
jgi:hypothetical protein